MPKRAAEEQHDALELGDVAIGTKSRSGRVVKPKVYNDGTVALLGSKVIDAVIDESNSKDASHDHICPRVAAVRFDDEGGSDSEAAASSDASYGMRRSSARLDVGRPQRRSAAAATRAPRANAAGGGGIFKAAAMEILRQEGRLMSTGEIARLALKRGLVKCTGKTPEATMASALYTDVKRREDFSVFIRPQEGLFGLREWVGQEQLPQMPQMLGTTDEGEEAAVDGTARATQTKTATQEAAAAMEHALRAADDAAAKSHHRSHYSPTEDAADRLMELLCAAEEINKAESESHGGSGGLLQEKEEDQEEDQEQGEVAKVEQLDVMEAQENDASVQEVLKDISAPKPVYSAPRITADAITSEAVRAGEAALQRLTRELGAGHPEVGKGYLTLARLYTADMPTPARKLAEGALSRAQAVMAECHTALDCRATTAPPALSVLVNRLHNHAMEVASLPLVTDQDSTQERLMQLQAALQTATAHAAAALEAAAARDAGRLLPARQATSNDENMPALTPSAAAAGAGTAAAPVATAPPVANVAVEETPAVDGKTAHVLPAAGVKRGGVVTIASTPAPVTDANQTSPRVAVASPVSPGFEAHRHSGQQQQSLIPLAPLRSVCQV